MRNRSGPVLLVFLSLCLISCGKTSLPTKLALPSVPPPVPQNEFQIKDIIVYHNNDLIWSFQAVVRYKNIDDQDIQVSGTIYFGTLTIGESSARFNPIKTYGMFSPVLPAQSSSDAFETWPTGYQFPATGTYGISIDLTAHFKTGDISSSFKKPFNLF